MMSSDSEFQNLIDSLLNNPDSSARMNAARALGDYVDNLNDEEYQEAKKALDSAMADPDPMVLTTAMGSLMRFNRQNDPRHISDEDMDVHGDAEEDILPPPTKAICDVCGRPEALIPQGGCERDDCPYK
jgi:HEAT repeat protein